MLESEQEVTSYLPCTIRRESCLMSSHAIIYFVSRYGGWGSDLLTLIKSHDCCKRFEKKIPYITKTYLYNFDPLKPHFYIVKLGFTGV